MASRLQFSLIFSCLLVCGVLADYPGFKTRETIAPLGHHRLAFSSLKRSAQHRQVQHDATRAIKDPKRETLINLLWNQNRDLVDQFLNVDFLKFQAEHPQNETLPSYQYYSVQDYYYLVDYVEYKALRMSTIPEFNSTHLLSDINAEADSIKSDTEYSWKFRNTTLVVDLAIPWSAIDNGKRSVQEIAYADWLQKNLDLGWFTLHVMSIPCIYGWTQLAAKLNSSDATLKGTMLPTLTCGRLTHNGRYDILQDMDKAKQRSQLCGQSLSILRGK
ncbi:hypothetical protein F5Y04DRAFT_292116 [Hypomontagnella monticulosa]|nr:hypothetical protein F5Y04DRAFT_292116 [Hypomontagnella monticulosa]